MCETKAIRRTAALLAAMCLLLLTLCLPGGAGAAAHATDLDAMLDAQLEEQYGEKEPQPTSESDIEAADFERVPMVPFNVEIPSFYKEVGNIAGMYVFTLPDGTVCKRIYGAVGGEFGWYVPEGTNNIVPVGAEPIDVEDDIEMYNDACAAAGIDPDVGQDFSGLLPPETTVTRITEVFGWPLMQVILVCVCAVAGMCIIILIGNNIASKHRD